MSGLIAMSICHRVQFIGVCNGLLKSMHALLWDPPMTPGCLVAGVFHASSRNRFYAEDSNLHPFN